MKQSFSARNISIFRSWNFIDQDIETELTRLETAGALTIDGDLPLLWATKSKFVLLLEFSGRRAIFKKYRKKWPFFRALWQLSPTAREALNYSRIAALGIPVPELLGVGETRRNGKLTGCFLLTGYVENSIDGRSYMTDRNFTELREEFIEFTRGHLALLAKLHDAGYWHKGFHTGNLLAVRQQNEPLKLFWIDVATCRKTGFFGKFTKITADLTAYLRCTDFTADERAGFIRDYLAARKTTAPAPEKLIAAVEKKLLRTGKAKLFAPVIIPPSKTT